MSLTIVADAGIPGVRAVFRDMGDVRLLPGHAITPAEVREADLLIVRTVTRVDAALLDGSRVRFVASPTSGTDHVDQARLAASGIGFASAAGCNARAVVEYVLSCLFALEEMRGFDPWNACIGIVGCGHVGGRLRDCLEALEIRCLVSDPPLREATGDARYLDLAALAEVDLLTLHVPLTDSGRHPTRRLVDGRFLAGMKANAIIVNAARGGVVDEAALLEFLRTRPKAAAVLDTWEGEPAINLDMLRHAAIGTPHIAGYSREARQRGLATVAAAAREFFGLPAPSGTNADARSGALPLRAEAGDEKSVVRRAVLAGYDVRRDDRLLRPITTLPPSRRGEYFAALRDRYALRTEFSGRPLELAARSPWAEHVLSDLGFEVTAA